jgi:hypothetical protein
MQLVHYWNASDSGHEQNRSSSLSYPPSFSWYILFFAWILGLLVAWYISAMAQLIQTPEK